MPNHSHTRFQTFFAIVIGWSVFGILLGEQVYALRADANPLTGNWKHAIFFELIYCYAWAAITPLVLMLGRAFPLESQKWMRSVPVHLVASLVCAAVTKVTHILVLRAMGLSWFPAIPPSLLLRSVLGMLDYGGILYWVVLLIGHSTRLLQRLHADQVQKSELQAQLAEAQLQALRMQMHPHFLFNALNSVAELIHQDPLAADRTLTRLGELLRIFLRSSATQQVPLEQEIDFLERYLEIQKIRFEERLTILINIEPATRTASVPSLILQPLVENAILHGIAHNTRGRLQIESSCRNGQLELLVTDNGNGNGITPDFGVEGLGLRSTRARLERVYANLFTFKLEHGQGGGAFAQIIIPLRLNGANYAADPSINR